MSSIMTPVLALIIWTIVIWAWLYATRIPAVKKHKIHPQKSIHPGSLDVLPSDVRVVADNYNHLHEQPTVFYALAIYSHLVGVADPLNVALAWGYVALRIVHSFAQIVIQKVMLRFSIFMVASLLLVIIAIRNVLALFV